MVSGALTAEDEAEVETELEELLAGETEGVTAEFPEVPKDKLPAIQKGKARLWVLSGFECVWKKPTM